VNHIYKVLIADTIEYNARMLESLAVWGNASGFEIIRKVYDGNEALELLRKESYDLVITEIDIHGMDGMQLLRHINQEKLSPLVVILSDTVEFQYVRECIMFGAFDYLKKMPDAATMMDLLFRAATALAQKKHEPQSIPDLHYPVAEEAKILQYILIHRREALELFSDTVDQIYSVKKEQELQNDILVKQLYLNIVTKVFEQYQWLKLYAAIEDYKKLDYLWAGSATGFKDFFLRKLGNLMDLIDRLYLNTSDKNLKILIEYIVNNPESDLHLKTVAENAFLTYAYLSNNFTIKLGMHFNEYIAIVKMAHAAFLLRNTDMKIYEICAAVLYQDTNYFTRQFKKIYGVSPSEYKAASEGAGALDYACL
jgi:two-component system response regulator YesN